MYGFRVCSNVKCAHVFTIAYLKYEASRARCVAQCTVCCTARHYCRTTNRIRRLHCLDGIRIYPPRHIPPRQFPPGQFPLPFYIVSDIYPLPPPADLQYKACTKSMEVGRLGSGVGLRVSASFQKKFSAS